MNTSGTMFFPWIGEVRIGRCGEAFSPENIQSDFLLVFALEKTDVLRAGNLCFTPKKNDVFLFSSDVYPLLHLPAENGAPVVIVSFSVADASLRQKVFSLGPQLFIDGLMARSCLMNILNSSALRRDNASDCISYNILSLLYHGYIGLQKQTASVDSIGSDVIFMLSPNAALNCILNYIDEHISEDITIGDLSDVSKQGPKQIVDLFREEFGCTVLQFINRFRLFRAKELLCYTNYSITEISCMTGFGSIHYFSRYFKEKEKIAPIEYKRTMQKMG